MLATDERLAESMRQESILPDSAGSVETRFFGPTSNESIKTTTFQHQMFTNTYILLLRLQFCLLWNDLFNRLPFDGLLLHLVMNLIEPLTDFADTNKRPECISLKATTP